MPVSFEKEYPAIFGPPFGTLGIDDKDEVEVEDVPEWVQKLRDTDEDEFRESVRDKLLAGTLRVFDEEKEVNGRFIGFRIYETIGIGAYNPYGIQNIDIDRTPPGCLRIFDDEEEEIFTWPKPTRSFSQIEASVDADKQRPESDRKIFQVMDMLMYPGCLFLVGEEEEIDENEYERKKTIKMLFELQKQHGFKKLMDRRELRGCLFLRGKEEELS